jgi:hypothetical protein
MQNSDHADFTPSNENENVCTLPHEMWILMVCMHRCEREIAMHDLIAVPIDYSTDTITFSIAKSLLCCVLFDD